MVEIVVRRAPKVYRAWECRDWPLLFDVVTDILMVFTLLYAPVFARMYL